MTPERRAHWLPLAAMGVLATAIWFVVDTRATDRLHHDRGVIDVTASTDSGPGSLREAIFRAAGAKRRVRIRLLASVSITTPLPPVTSPHGMVIGCELEPGPCTLDASALERGPALDLHAPSTRVEDLSIVGASNVGVLVRAASVTLQRMRFRGNAVGVQIIDGVSGTTVSDSVFQDNGSGIRIEGNATRVVVHGNIFRENAVSGLWAVSATQVSGHAGDALLVRDNQFIGNQIGALAIHLPALFENNLVSESTDIGVFLGGARNTFAANRVTATGTTGVFGDEVSQSRIERNEIADNPSVGLLVRGGSSNRVTNNRVYRNGFGIAVLRTSTAETSSFTDNLLFSQRHDALWFFTEALPLLRGNRIVNNRGAGIRFVTSIAETPSGATPWADHAALLAGANDLEQNGAPVVREFYSEEVARQ